MAVMARVIGKTHMVWQKRYFSSHQADLAAFSKAVCYTAVASTADLCCKGVILTVEDTSSRKACDMATISTYPPIMPDALPTRHQSQMADCSTLQALLCLQNNGMHVPRAVSIWYQVQLANRYTLQAWLFHQHNGIAQHGY